MTEIDWYEAGRKSGRELAEIGGSAANVDIDSIGFQEGKSWLDGLLDALRERGLDAKSIAFSPRLEEDFRNSEEWGDDLTYRGIQIMPVDDVSDHSSIVVAA